MKILSFTDSLSAAYLPFTPKANELNKFSQSLEVFIDKTNPDETEEHNKNLIPTFLQAFAYQDKKYEINTVGKIDLAISKEGYVEVLIEVKRPYSKKNRVEEMVRCDDMNRKAFGEVLLYYMRQVNPGKNAVSNPYIKHCIITNNTEWFIIDSHFIKDIAGHKEIVKAYREIDRDGTASNTSTNAFYTKVKEIIATKKLLENLEFVYINFEEKYSPTQLRDIYKLLTPRHLLKELGENDSNKLNKKFYNELLHILGLEETGKTKKLIQRKSRSDFNGGSLLENTITKLETEFGIADENNLFEIALELNITWLNRLLFLKLLEAKLVFMHRDSNTFDKFLTPSIVENFDILNTLFFEVLAKKLNDRESLTIKAFETIPYLNSSLFETTTLERQYLRISGLKDNLTISVISATKTGMNGEQNTLEYLLTFLNSYDFGGDASDVVKKDSETLINASVLGLIFEKINGYKDGSFFTPSFITMYMTKESIRKSVVDKFNTEFGWNCKTINCIYDKEPNIDTANRIIDSITICDPAVGSGHFLVSALNEILVVKSELKILKTKDKSKKIRTEIFIENDELYIKDTDGNGEFFKYQKNGTGSFFNASQEIQEAIFHEKQRIIENQLFGVDINPNSVKITRLRLWIELLKNSYYENDELITLPNIDINIKCGNSLISKFSLNDSDTKNKLLKDKINEYKSLVKKYMSENNKITKKEIEDKIKKLKKDFKKGLHEFSPTMVKFKKALKEYVSNYKYDGLSEELILLAVKSNHGLQIGFFDDDKDIQKAKATTKDTMFKRLNKIHQRIKVFQNNEIYENSFEWRFEFPEVLNEDGDFVGFDIIIGNPPYISAKTMSNQDNKTREYLKDNYKFLTNKWDIYIAFLEMSLNISNPTTIISMIIPNAFVSERYSNQIREYLINNKFIDSINFYEFDIFENAAVNNVILTLNLSINPFPKQRIYKTILDFTETNIITEDIFKSQHNRINRLLKSELYLGDICFISKGMVLHANQKVAKELFVKSDLICDIQDKIHTKRYTEGKWIDKNEINTIKYLEWNTDRVPSQISRPTFIELYENNKILINKLGQMKAVYDNSRIYCDQTIRVLVKYIDLQGIKNRSIESSIKKFSNYERDKLENLSTEFGLKYIVALLNSKVYAYILDVLRTKESIDLNPLILRKLPIPRISKEEQQPYIKIVDEVIALKKKNKDTKILEKKLDEIVYNLYELTIEEIKIIDTDQEKAITQT